MKTTNLSYSKASKPRKTNQPSAASEAKALARLNAQIAKLQKEAAALAFKERAAVVARLKVDIAKFVLTAAELGLVASTQPAAKQLKKAVAKKTGTVTPARAVQVAKAGKAGEAKAASSVPTQPAARQAATPKVTKRAGKPVGVIKYADDAGHTWTGHGKRPDWFKAAIDSGQTAADLLVSTPV